MKIATFNINGISSRLSALLDWLAKEKPDIVCLQELKATDLAFPAPALREAGYGAIWQGQRSWNGVAILARGQQPLEVRRGLPGNDSDENSRYLEAAIDGIIIACIYLPNGNPQPGPKFDYKLAWFERLIAHARSLYDSGHPVVLAGDFNVIPTDFDIYNIRSWKKDALLQPASREAYRRLLDQGWTDSLRFKHPDEPMFTFWDYFRNHWQTNSGLRIDHLLLSAPLTPTLMKAGVDSWVRGRPHASDHAPAWIELRDSALARLGQSMTRPPKKQPAAKPPRSKPASPSRSKQAKPLGSKAAKASHSKAVTPLRSNTTGASHSKAVTPSRSKTTRASLFKGATPTRPEAGTSSRSKATTPARSKAATSSRSKAAKPSPK